MGNYHGNGFDEDDNAIIAVLLAQNGLIFAKLLENPVGESEMIRLYNLEDDIGRFSRDRTARNLFGSMCSRKVMAKSLEPDSTNYVAVDLELALNDT